METQISFNKIFYNIFGHIADSIKYKYGLYYLLAGIFTFFIVISGLDWAWYKFSTTHIWIFSAGFISVFAGMFVPVIALPLLYIYARVKKHSRLQIITLALGQAAVLGMAISTFIKIFTGRLPPEHFAGLVNNSGGFQFGLYRGGWFNGWPSSHTTIAFAMAMTLIGLCPNNKAVKICAWIFATGIGLGVSFNIHWLSDAVAGALIGFSIGKVISADFKKLIV
jgi:membrane-associated phospholipid phosphatase